MSKSKRPASIFETPAPRYYSIDHGRPFLPDLAEGLVDALGGDLTRARIYLPTRRAVRGASLAFLDAFSRLNKNAVLLPRFYAIGDIDADEILAFDANAADEMDAPPAISPGDRLLALARFAARKNAILAGDENWPAALSAGRELGRLLDSFYTEEISPAAIRTLDVEDVAGHWAQSLDFLSIIIDEWPKFLAEIGKSDPAQRRARLIDAAARRLRAEPPEYPIIIAGTTGSAPGVVRLAAAIAAAPRGAAILPGLDLNSDARAWAAIDLEDAHPQSGLKAMIGALGVTREAVRVFPNSGGENRRSQVLTLALRPAEATDEWPRLVSAMTAKDPGLVSASRGLSIVEADNEEAEASIVAAAMRLALETPRRTAMLVTPDRGLARRTALELRRWNVDVEDSAGTPFGETSCGAFLRLLARFLDAPDDPVAILALIDHRLATFGLDIREKRDGAGIIDRALRAACMPNALHVVDADLGSSRSDIAARRIIETLSNAAAEFSKARALAFGLQFERHLAAAEGISGARLWSGADGGFGAELAADLRDSAALIGGVGGGRYAALFDELIGGQNVRASQGGHPRLSILGPLEARLQSADLIILGGLNEGVWPHQSARDPFLSARMRKAAGLPSVERRIGLSAHDFFGLAAGGDVMLTRSRRAGGAPTNASRWLVRLANILKRAGGLAAVDGSTTWQSIIAGLDAPLAVSPAPMPQPKGGPGRRPREISVTSVEKWIRDPYGIYAQYLLGLRKLDDPGRTASYRELGNLIHKIYEIAAAKDEAPTPASLNALYDGLAPGFGFDEAARRFNSEAIAEAFAWFAEFDGARRRLSEKSLVEVRGKIDIAALDPPLTLKAIADRIDIVGDDKAEIFDYKTGRIPTGRQAEIFSLQLALAAAILEAGGFTDAGSLKIARFAYLKAFGRNAADNKNELAYTGDEAPIAARQAIDNLERWARTFDDPATPYLSQPRPEFTSDYGDYDQLARRREWGVDAQGGDSE